MSASISRIIRSFSGLPYEIAGTINGYFDSPQLAKACAHSIELEFNREVHVCGCELYLSL